MSLHIDLSPSSSSLSEEGDSLLSRSESGGRDFDRITALPLLAPHRPDPLTKERKRRAHITNQFPLFSPFDPHPPSHKSRTIS